MTVLFVLSFVSVFAQNEKELLEVIVSAPKFQEKLSRTGKVVSIIDSAQIAQAQGKGIVELLQMQVGIHTVGARSAWGANQELYVRGSNTGQVLILMDGFPLNDPSHISQVFDWNLLDLSQVNRIEILKGGQSTLYGSDAMAGVINIVTNSKTNKNMEAFASITVGSYGSFAPSFSFNKKIKSNVLTLSASHTRASGFSAADVQNGEVDGFHREQFRLAWTSYLHANWELNAQVKGSVYAGNLDAGPFTDDLDYTSKAQALSWNAQLKFNGTWAEVYFRFFSDFSLRRFQDDSTYVPQNAYNSYFYSNYAGLSQGLEMYAKSEISKDYQIVYGMEHRWQHAAQSDFYYGFGVGFSSLEIKPDQAKQTITAGYLTLQKEWEKVGLELGGRINHQSTFGTFSTFSWNPYVRLGNSWKLFGNLNTGFKVPSLYQLFSAYGNLELMPEKSLSTEVGFQFKESRSFIRLVGFLQDIKDGIGFQSKNEAPFGQYFNISNQNNLGLEFDFYQLLGKIKYSGNFTFLSGSSEMMENGQWKTKDFLVRRPKVQGQIQAEIPIKKKVFGVISYQYVGKRYDLVYDDATFSTVQKELMPYHWVDMSVNFQVNKKLRLNLMVKNALNQKITEQFGYNGMPIVLTGGVALVI